MQKPAEHLGFTSAGRHVEEEEEITLTSVGVDIGSSTSHLVFSRLELEHRGTRYIVRRRTILNESAILLTPYVDDSTIDADALGTFIDAQYHAAGLRRDEIDTGALILTGVAVRRRNARAIGELFASEAGRFVAVSAGDGLETTMAAHGSGAVAHSARSSGVTLNIDVGGGTSKIAVCSGGRVLEVTALDVGARLVAFDEGGVVTRIEDAGRKFAAEVGVDLRIGETLAEADRRAMADRMTDRLFEVLEAGELSGETVSLLRLPPLTYRGKIDTVMFSGGVSEFIYGREQRSFGDLGAELAQVVRGRIGALGALMMVPVQGIRATVIGASQYTIQVSGNTIFLSPQDAVPVRNVPVVSPEFDLSGDDIAADAVRRAVEAGLTRLDLAAADSAVAVAFHWEGSATFWRLQNFCQGVAEGMRGVLTKGHPLVLVSDGDIGGLLGLHLKEEIGLAEPVISIDGIDLREFDYIDIGALLPSSGAVPVVIKSLVFPASVEGAAR